MLWLFLLIVALSLIVGFLCVLIKRLIDYLVKQKVKQIKLESALQNDLNKVIFSELKDNIEDFFKAGFRSVGMGSSLIKKDYLKNQDWDSLDKHVGEIKKIIDRL